MMLVTHGAFSYGKKRMIAHENMERLLQGVLK
jgi:hypothetical protein